MGKRHAAAAAGIAAAQTDEQVREAEARRQSAERERQLLTSYLGTADQVAGTGAFSNASPEVLKYTQRYSVDQRALADILAAGSQVKRQEDPFQGADNRVRGGLSIGDYGQGFADRANDLLAQAEAAARAGDFSTADRLFAQAQSVIGGVSQVAQGAYNLGGGEESAARIRASSTEGRIVGRQLLTAQQLGDPNSDTSIDLRGRLLDPSLAVIDENTRNAERAIAAERSELEGQIRQTGSGGIGLNPRAQLAQQAAVSRDAALQRAQVYSLAGAQKAAATAQINLYLNEFAKRMAEDSVRLSQEWVNGTAGVRDQYQEALDRFDIISIDIANQRAQMLAQMAENRRREAKASKALRREAIFGFATGSLPIATIFGGGGAQLGSTSGLGASSGDIGAGASLGTGAAVGEDGGAGAAGAIGGGASGAAGGGGGGGGGGAGIGQIIGAIGAFL